MPEHQNNKHLFHKCLGTVVLLIVMLVITSLLSRSILAQKNYTQTIQSFALPLYDNTYDYGPILQYYGNPLIKVEDTRYGIHNPDLAGSSCFGIPLKDAYHAGEDWYRFDRNTGTMMDTVGTDVKSVADGTVVHISDPTIVLYPGVAIIIEHPLSPPINGHDKIYSVYIHLNLAVYVNQGDSVSKGQIIGTVLAQPWVGNNPDPARPLYDSHLHWEMRYFLDGSNIYDPSTNCNNPNVVAGRGYTYPQHPDDFPANTPYINPSALIGYKIYLPFVVAKTSDNCPTGINLIDNSGFEDGIVIWQEQSPVSIITQNSPIPPFRGQWMAWFAGYNSADDTLYQDITIPFGATGADITYYTWMNTEHASTTPFDHLYVNLRDTNNNLILELDQIDNTDVKLMWLQKTISIVGLGSWAGQKMRISFESSSDDTLITNFFVDDVSFLINCKQTGNSLQVTSIQIHQFKEHNLLM